MLKKHGRKKKPLVETTDSKGSNKGVSIVSDEYNSTALDEVRMGCLQRFTLALVSLISGQRHEAEFQYHMGLDRMRNTGDYAPGGQFDSIYPGWRDADTTHRQVSWKRSHAPTSDG